MTRGIIVPLCKDFPAVGEEDVPHKGTAQQEDHERDDPKETACLIGFSP